MQSLASSFHLMHWWTKPISQPSQCHWTQLNRRQLPKNSTQPNPTYGCGYATLISISQSLTLDSPRLVLIQTQVCLCMFTVQHICPSMFELLGGWWRLRGLNPPSRLSALPRRQIGLSHDSSGSHFQHAPFPQKKWTHRYSRDHRSSFSVLVLAYPG